MGWERGRYYTRSRKVDGRVVREYVGTGPLAQFEAEQDRQRRVEREATRQTWRQEQSAILEAEKAMEEFAAACTVAMRAALTAAGYHQHDRGEWRKRRGKGQTDTT